MAQKLEDLIKGVSSVLGERKKLQQVEKRLVKTLNKALNKIGYQVVAARGAAPGRRRRVARKVGVGRPRAARRRGARRPRPRGKKG